MTPENQTERFAVAVNALIGTCNELAVINRLTVREIIASLSVVAIELAKQSGDISLEDFKQMTRHMGRDAERNLK